MLFNSWVFIIFFFQAFIFGFWILKNKISRYIWIIIFSLVFYAFWNLYYASILVISVVVSYIFGLAIGRYSRLPILWLAIFFHLGLLFYFKYFNFINEIVNNIVGGNSDPINVILPLGISFYTFHIISYYVDIHLKRIQSVKNFLKYATYLVFFPQLIAGPISRYSEVKDDYESIDKKIQPDFIKQGLFLFIIGLSKKVIIADMLGRVVDIYYSQFSSTDSLTLLFVVFAYGVQLYFDFSGYSDMALGLALMAGVKLPINFNSPFKAKNIPEFWNRWNMTLSKFITVYVFIPLSDVLPRNIWGIFFNLIFVFLLWGIWHGAGWNFIVFGLIHGILSIIYHATKRYYSLLPGLVQTFITFTAVIFSFIFFRSPNLVTAFAIIGRIATVNGVFSISPYIANLLFFLILGLVIIFFLPFNSNSFKLPQKPIFFIILGALFFIACIFMGTGEEIFLYYQF